MPWLTTDARWSRNRRLTQSGPSWARVRTLLPAMSTSPRPVRPRARRRVGLRRTASTWLGRRRRAKWRNGRRSRRRTTSKSNTGGTDSTSPATAPGTLAAVASAVRAPKQLPTSTGRRSRSAAQSTAARASATYSRSRRTISSPVPPDSASPW